MLRLIKNTALVSSALLLPAIVSAGYVAERLYCEDAPGSRVVEVHYEDPYSGLLCTIREKKQGQPSTVLWRARNQVNFCVEQLKLYREKLAAGGLQCELLPANDYLPLPDSQQLLTEKPVAATESEVPESISWTTIVTTELSRGERRAVAESRSPAAQAIELPYLTKNKSSTDWPETRDSSWSDFSPEYEPQLVSSPENVFIDPKKALDNWVIFVSAKTLANIKTLLSSEPTVFEDYLLYEQQNAQTIYSKLQLRIHHLTEIAIAQKSVVQ